MTSNTLSYSLLHDQHTLTYSLLHDQQHNVILIVTWPATHAKTHGAARGVDHLPHPQTHNWRSPQQYPQHTTIRSAISHPGKRSTIMACCNSPPPPDYIDTMSLSTAIDPIDTLHNTYHNKDLRVTLCTQTVIQNTEWMRQQHQCTNIPASESIYIATQSKLCTPGYRYKVFIVYNKFNKFK